MKKLLKTTALISAIAMFSGAVAAERQYLNIGTAGIGGGYYPTGGFICNLVNKSRKKNGHNIRCTVESTGGSVANLRSIQSGELDVGIAQADWQYHSKNGTSKFEKDGKNEKLRFLFSLHMDVAQLVAKKSIGAKSFKDLKGKVFNIGNVGSGQEASFRFALNQYGLKPSEFFSKATQLTSKEQSSALCDGKIDGFFYTAGIGASTITEAANSCDISILNWEDDTIKKMISEYPYYGTAIIPANSYKGQTEKVTTWGMPATIVASADTDEEVVYQLVKAIFDNFEDLKKQSSMYVGLTREGSVKNGQSAPYHPGALRYFKEVGLIK